MRAIIFACALMLQDQFNRDGQVLAIQLQVTGAMKSQIIKDEKVAEAPAVVPPIA